MLTRNFKMESLREYFPREKEKKLHFFKLVLAAKRRERAKRRTRRVPMLKKHSKLILLLSINSDS
jgi:hypothetical protein